MLILPTAKADTPITGTAYGENIGLIHFDYTTAYNPFDECADPFDTDPDAINCPYHAEYTDYHRGPREDFYIHPMAPDYDSSGFNSNFVARISDATSCTDDYCLLDGFLWSDEISWIALNGEIIQTSIENANASTPGFDINTVFPDTSFARISTSTGMLTGYIWSEKTGWIKLSSDGFITSPSASQSQSNWGVWLNPFTDPDAPLTSWVCAGKDELTCNSLSHICLWDSSACSPLSIEIGRPLLGYAWSQKLGWIKFDKEGEFFNGVYTTWIPDTTPPELSVDEDNIWFANDNTAGILTWENFASDPESGIDLDETKFSVTTTDTGCALGIDDTDTDTSNDSNLSIDSSTHRLKISLPTYGIVDETTDGYCKYELTGKIVNGAGLTYNINTPITFFVRAGEYDADSSSISASTATCTDPALIAIADGEDCYEYHFEPVDIAGNPIVSVEVKQDGTASTIPSEWMREAENKFVFDSATYFDEILPPPSGVHTVPISFNGTVLISQLDNEQIEYLSVLLDATKTYPVQVNAFAPTTGSNDFDINSTVITIRDSEMPRISEFVGVTDPVASFDTTYNESIVLSFAPAISITSGSLDTDVLIPAVDMVATYQITNHSPTVDIGEYAVDSRMYFENIGGDG